MGSDDDLGKDVEKPRTKSGGVPELNQDTYFLDPDYGRLVAAQARVIEVNGVRRLQLCYCAGSVDPAGPMNLIAVPVERFSEVFSKTRLPLPTYLHFPAGLDPARAAELSDSFAQLLAMVEEHRAHADGGSPQQVDSYFFSPRDAFREAVQRHPVELGHPTVFGLQVCWHDGEPLTGAPDNMIALPCERVAEVLATTRLRLPRSVPLPEDTPPATRLELDRVFNELVAQAVGDRGSRIRSLEAEARALEPAPGAVRVFLPANRETQVMQYASRGLAGAFRRLGLETLLSIQQNAMEAMDRMSRLEDYVAFRPSLVVNINHLDNRDLAPGVYNLAWYQDPMPEITRQNPLPWRERDIPMSVYSEFDGYLAACGAPRVYRQPFCIDPTVFHRELGVEPVHKVVFAGSSYMARVRKLGTPAWEAIRALQAHFAAGENLDRELVGFYARRHGLTLLELWQGPLNYVVRDGAVRWLCEQARVPVEVYGRYWDLDPVVAPHFRGEVSHGPELAAIYRRASHALVCQPQEVNSQRLAEVCACGAHPLVYDCRDHAEPPFWDDTCLYFRTCEELYARLQEFPAGDPTLLAGHFTYDAMARRVLDIIGGGGGTAFAAPGTWAGGGADGLPGT
jgi:hypothetical protein